MTQITHTPVKLTITREDIDDAGNYIGASDVSAWQGRIEIAADLGWVRFAGDVRATQSIIAMQGSGIKAGDSIKAGWGIEAGDSIEAGSGIKAGDSIEAGDSIKAGGGIEAGSGIKAGLGIEAGLGIKAKWLSVRLRIFAGVCMWRLPEPGEMEIRAELRSGTVAFGKHIQPDRMHMQ